MARVKKTGRRYQIRLEEPTPKNRWVVIDDVPLIESDARFRLVASEGSEYKARVNWDVDEDESIEQYQATWLPPDPDEPGEPSTFLSKDEDGRELRYATDLLTSAVRIGSEVVIYDDDDPRSREERARSERPPGKYHVVSIVPRT